MAASCLGFPMDMIATLYDMMAGGVFDRFPTMPTMILEAGVGWLPSMFERFEEHQKMFGRIKAPEWKTPPMEIFERQMMVTVEACEETDLQIALEFLPADHVALASDWPHYDGTPDLLERLPQGERPASTRPSSRWSRPARSSAGSPPVALEAGVVRSTARRSTGRRRARPSDRTTGAGRAASDGHVRRARSLREPRRATCWRPRARCRRPGRADAARTSSSSSP